MNLATTAIALLAAAVVLVPVFRWAKLGGVLGYIVAGVLIGPEVLGVVKDAQTLLHVSEWGVTLLMFLVGLELQPSRLMALRREIFGLGAAQVLGCASLGAALAMMLGLPLPAALIVGAALAMSSTAFILPMLSDANATQSRYGREAVAVCIFQDLAVIPILLLISLTGASSGKIPGWSALFLVVLLAVAGRTVLRWVFAYAAKFGNNEVFTAAALCVSITISLGLEFVGLSASLGAFIAGVLLADSAFKHKLEASIAPFEGLLLGMFFMAVGMGVHLAVLIDNPIVPLAIGLGIILGKALLVYMVRLLFAPLLGQAKCDSHTALRLAFTLAVGGEFAFVLFQAGQSAGYFSAKTVDILTLGVVISMVLAPVSVMILNRILSRETLPDRAFDTPEDTEPQVIIAGFGRVGQVVGRLLNAQNLTFTALDASPDHVDTIRQFGNKIYYGDARELGLLEAAHVGKAALLVLAVDDVDASIEIAERVLQHYPKVRIIARARNRGHFLRLRALGIETVIRETWLSSIEMGRETLKVFGLSGEPAEALIARFVKHDEMLLQRQALVAEGDVQAMILLTRQARADLAGILQADYETRQEDKAILKPM